MEAYELEHIAKVRAVSPECMVLLKSDGSFPLQKPGKIALYGNAAYPITRGDLEKCVARVIEITWRLAAQR